MNVGEKELKAFDETLLELIRESAVSKAPIRPDGFGITRNEYKEREDIGYDRAKDILEELVECGIFEKKMMVEKNSQGKSLVYFVKGKEIK